MSPLRRAAAALLLVPALAGPVLAGDTPRVVLDGPASVRTPHAIAVVTGRVEGATGLRVSVRSGERSVAFEAPLGRDAIAFESDGPLDPGVAEVVRARLRALDVEDAAAHLSGSVLVALVRSDDDARLSSVLDAMRAEPLPLRLRIQVLPRERYHAGSEGTPPRLADRAAWPWPGTSDEFDAFLRGEIERWRARGKEPYVPSRPGFAVARRAGAPGEGAEDFVLLEEPRAGEESFDERTFADVWVGQDPQTTMPVLLLEVAGPRQPAFRAFTERNQGMPLAMVVGGEVTSMPIIQGVLEDRVQVTLGRGLRADVEREARDLALRLAAGIAGGRTPRLRPAAMLRLAEDGRFQVSAPLDAGVAIDVRPARTDPGTPASAVEFVRAADAAPSAAETLLAHLALEAWGRPEEAAAVAGPLDAEEGPPLEAVALGSAHAGDRFAARVRWDRWLADRPEETAKAVASLLRAPPSAEAQDRAWRRQTLRDLAPRAMGAVEAALRDPSPEVRAAAVGILAGVLRDESDLRRLLAAGRDEALSVRTAAFFAIGNVFWDPFAGVEDAPPTATMPKPLLVEAVRLLDEAVGKEGGKHAAYALARIVPDGQVATLRWTTSADPRVREHAFGALAYARAKDAGAVAAFARGLEDADARVRYVAAMAHRAATGDATASAATLRRLATDPKVEREVRLGALTTPLLLEGSTEADWTLARSLLTDADDVLRRAAALLLASEGRADDRTLRLADETIEAPPEDLVFLVRALRDSRRLPRSPR